MKPIQYLTDCPEIKSVYISGPMTGYPDMNTLAFVEATAKIRALGLRVVSPSELDAEDMKTTDELSTVDSGDPQWTELVSRDVVHVLDVDALVVLPQWQKSRGSKVEVYLAVALSKPVYSVVDLSLVPIGELPQPEQEGTILDEAARRTGDEKLEEYGHPLEDFTRTAKIMSAILDHEIRPEQVPLLMMAVKLSRYTHSPSRDGLADIAGYARTAELVSEELGGYYKLRHRNKPGADGEATQ